MELLNPQKQSFELLPCVWTITNPQKSDTMNRHGISWLLGNQPEKNSEHYISQLIQIQVSFTGQL